VPARTRSASIRRNAVPPMLETGIEIGKAENGR
jgi:hypothetical protein